MCGWPAGVGYPPAEGEIETAAALVQPDESTVDDGADHSAAQLDALAGMAQRQGQPAAARTASSERSAPETDDVDPLTAPLEVLPERPAATRAELEATPLHDTVVTEVAEASATEVSARGTSVRASRNARPQTTTPQGPEPGRAAALARPTQLLIVAAAVLNVLLAGLQAAFGTPVDSSMTTVVLGTALLTLAVWTGAAVCFLHWVSRAYAHVAAYSEYRQRHGAVMALVGWLIPVVGFVVGYRVLQDLWTGSNPDTRADQNAKPGGTQMIDLWLLALVTATVFAYALPAALGASSLWSGIAALGVLIAGLALASTVSRISDWQSEAWSREDAASRVTAPSGTVSTRVDDVSATVATSERTREPAHSATD